MPPRFNGHSVEFLEDETVTELLRLTDFPEFFDAADQAEVDSVGRFKWRYAEPGVRRAIAPEDLLECAMGAPLQETAEPVKVTASYSLPFAPRGQANVPIFAGQSVELIDTVVPEGMILWIDGYAFNLFPNVANELNYWWQLRVNGQNILNTNGGGNPPQPGRPVQAPQKVIIGSDKSTMILVQPGSRIEVVVTAISTIGASDSISATVFGTLQGT